MKSLSWRWPFGAVRVEQARSEASSAMGRALPSRPLRWVGEGERLAVREFDWDADADFICQWQRETYALNFPHFTLTSEFTQAFRHDLRRATLDPHHALFVLDERPQGGSICGFVWAVLCLNTWTRERYGYVNNLYVVPEKRGQHLGEELLKQAETWFASQNVSKLRLTVTASNESARKLYERAGYVVERLEMEKGHQ